MRYRLIALWMLLCAALPASAQTYINFNTPGVSISINVPIYPTLQRVPGYPVYYAPSLRSNYFFYDGLYWVYEEDNWYSSSWYNGPWWIVDSMEVPYFVLRVPVRYYRHAPSYFRGWSMNDSPRWGDHWGTSWQQRRGDWNRWDRSRSPSPAPLPNYQRQYSGTRYPQAVQQATIQTRDYRYQPSDAIAQRQFQHQRTQAQAVAPQPQRSRPPAPAVQPQRGQPPADAPRAYEQRANEQRGNDQRVNRAPAQRGEVQPAPATTEQSNPRQQSRPQQNARPSPEPGTRAPQPQQASPPPSPRGERRTQQAPATQDQPAANPRQPPAQSERASPPQKGRDQPPPQQPARANDRPDKNQGHDNGKGKGNDGEKGNEKDKKDRDR